jgi:hypothetical protein
LALLAQSPKLSEQWDGFEEHPNTHSRVAITAENQHLPVKIMIPGEAMCNAVEVVDNTLYYLVMRDFRHPENGAYLATYNDLSREFNLNPAQKTYADGRVENKVSLQIKRNLSGVQPGDTLVLVPDSQADRIMLLDYTNGDIVDENFIPANPGNLSTPVKAQQHPAGFITVSDQIEDAVLSFDSSGTFLGIFAPAGGVNNAILDNARGHAYLPNKHLVVCNFAGGNAHAVVEFDSVGNYVGNFIAPGSGGLESPWDMLLRTSDLLVSASGTDAVLQYDLNGNFIDIFAANLNFPRQIIEFPDGRVGVANFSPGSQSGIYIYSADGDTLIDFINTIGSNRGLLLLKNGNLLTSNATGIWEIDIHSGAVVDSIINISGQHFGLYIVPQSGLPEITLSAEAIDFDTVYVGQSADESLRVYNTGIADLKIGAVVEQFGGAFAVSPDTLTIAPGDSGIFAVRFQPLDIGEFIGGLVLTHNAGGGPDTVVLHGVGISPTAIEPVDASLPRHFALYQNYPNPFNPTTTIKFAVAEYGFVKISIYNQNGQLVTYLVNQHLNPGYYQVNFNALNLASGIYFYKMQSGTYKMTRKMLLVK